MNLKFVLNIFCLTLLVGAFVPALSLQDQSAFTAKAQTQAPDATDNVPAPRGLEDTSLIHSAIPMPASSEPANKVKVQPPRQSDLTSKRREVPTITYGTPPWAIVRPKRKIPTPNNTTSGSTAPGTAAGGTAAGGTAAGGTTAGNAATIQGTAQGALRQPLSSTGKPPLSLIEKADVNGTELEQREPEPYTTMNIRILVPHEKQVVDVVYAYPYPVKPPPLTGLTQPLPDKPSDLKGMILSAGYSDRIDFNRPYPNYGWRWVHAFSRAHDRSGLGYPHSMITMYRWVDEMMPYVVAEVKRSNNEEGERIARHMKFTEEFETTHVEVENRATLNGLVPIEIKMNTKGIGQAKLTTGNWWITGTRKVPGLKLFWEVPVTCHAGQIINAQLTEANALIIQGGW